MWYTHEVSEWYRDFLPVDEVIFGISSLELKRF